MRFEEVLDEMRYLEEFHGNESKRELWYALKRWLLGRIQELKSRQEEEDQSAEQVQEQPGISQGRAQRTRQG